MRSRRAEVAHYLLDHGAQVDVFCTAFLGQLERNLARHGLAEKRIMRRLDQPFTLLVRS